MRYSIWNDSRLRSASRNTARHRAASAGRIGPKPPPLNSSRPPPRTVRRDRLDPAATDLVFHRAAHELQPLLVEVVAQPVSIGHPDRDRQRVGHTAEAPFAFAYSNLVDLPLGDVQVCDHRALLVAAQGLRGHQ